MKNSFSISVQEPCSENFDHFSKTRQGGFCNSCQKEVIDFTKLSNEQLIQHFEKDNGKTCGRFMKSQLKNYSPMIHNDSNKKIVSKGLALMTFSLLSLCTVSNLQGQEVASNEPQVKIAAATNAAPFVIGEITLDKHTVTGTVLDQDDLPLGGVNVVLKGTAEGTQTDFDGRFEFPIPLDVNDILVFSYIGYGKKEHKVTASETDNQDITIRFDLSDIELMGEVVVGGAYKSKRNIFQKFIALFK